MSRRSWFAVQGSLEPIDYDGPSFFRFPQAVAEHVIQRCSAPGDWVIDRFCGFGTTLAAAERLGRHAVGCEADQRRAAFSAARPANVDRVVHGRCEDLTRRSGRHVRCCSPVLAGERRRAVRACAGRGGSGAGQHDHLGTGGHA